MSFSGITPSLARALITAFEIFTLSARAFFANRFFEIILKSILTLLGAKE